MLAIFVGGHQTSFLGKKPGRTERFTYGHTLNIPIIYPYPHFVGKGNSTTGNDKIKYINKAIDLQTVVIIYKICYIPCDEVTHS